MKKLVIEIIYDNQGDAEIMLSEISLDYILMNKIFTRQIRQSEMNCNMSIILPLIEPRVEEINGKKCFIYPSSMNESKKK